MKNVDRWFILTGLLYCTFGVAFGIWMGIHERFDLAPIHAHVNLVGFASMVLFRKPARSLSLHHLHARRHPIRCRPAPCRGASNDCAGGDGLVNGPIGFLVFLVNYLLNGFSAKASA
jgi:hypothetical protein